VRDVPALRQPLRVIVDSRLETPPNARILEGGNVLIAAAVGDAERARALREAGAEIVLLPNPAGKVDLAALMQALGRRGVNELLAEAGFKLNGSLLREGLVDELLLYLAPSLIGDAARGLFDLPGLTDLSGQRRLDLQDVRRVGSDLRILARPV
jgi:diaminohydroxyphosphoribosylaminopyrimidine deaminase/5-amino-6-(5-phosphoribosylamino)uracil reductase